MEAVRSADWVAWCREYRRNAGQEIDIPNIEYRELIQSVCASASLQVQTRERAGEHDSRHDLEEAQHADTIVGLIASVVSP